PVAWLPPPAQPCLEPLFPALLFLVPPTLPERPAKLARAGIVGTGRTCQDACDAWRKAEHSSTVVSACSPIPTPHFWLGISGRWLAVACPAMPVLHPVHSTNPTRSTQTKVQQRADTVG